jgi:hypothetical protein
MKILDIQQGSAEWHARRRCTITGTKLDDVMGTALAQVQLAAELIAEKGTEQSKIIRPTEEMERGNAEEEFAIKRYEQETGKKVVRGGMWVSYENDWHAHSPDGSIVEANGDVLEAIEVKNPDSKTAIFYRLANMIPNEELGLTKSKIPFLGIPQDYKWQCVNAFIVNEKLQKLHFLVHDARFINDGVKLYVVTLNRNNEVLQEAIKEAKKALAEFRDKWTRWEEVVLPSNF